jgi:hypothetical protein
MSWKANVMVVANKTADAPELLEVLRARAAQGPAEFVLVFPQHDTDHAGAVAALERALEAMRDAGLVATGVVCDRDPLVAVQEEWDPIRFDEVIVSTLPMNTSRWLRVDLPRRVANVTGVSVKHVVASPRAVGATPVRG